MSRKPIGFNHVYVYNYVDLDNLNLQNVNVLQIQVKQTLLYQGLFDLTCYILDTKTVFMSISYKCDLTD